MNQAWWHVMAETSTKAGKLVLYFFYGINNARLEKT